MKISKLAAILAIGMATAMNVANADDNFKFGGYFRSGFGQSGGKERVCPNDGQAGNQFRLGNECGTYIETGLNYGIGGKNYADSKARAHLNFAYTGAANRRSYETATTNLVESYVDMNVEGLSWWAGKRFYRWGDIHMNDFFYFANSSGTGTGVESIKTSYGTWAVAVLQSTSTTATTDDGNLAKTVLDARLADVVIADNHKMDVWLAVAQNAGGTQTASGSGSTAVAAANYKSVGGQALGLRLNSAMGDMQNTAAFIYGTGAMTSQDLDTVYAQATTGSDTTTGASSKRLVENLYYKGASWDINGTVMYQETITGPDAAVNTKWTSLGVRPTYYITDVYSVTGQYGRSAVKTDVAGSTENYLQDTTLAFQVQPKMGLYARPSIRFYATNRNWNTDNTAVKGSSAVLANRTSYASVGSQVEVWF